MAEEAEAAVAGLRRLDPPPTTRAAPDPSTRAAAPPIAACLVFFKGFFLDTARFESRFFAKGEPAALYLRKRRGGREGEKEKGGEGEEEEEEGEEEKGEEGEV